VAQGLLNVSKETRNSRMVLLLIAGLPVTMILLATWLWVYVVDGEIDIVQIMGTANRGQLLEPPLPLQDQTLLLASGEPFQLLEELDPKWKILIPGASECAAACEQALYYTRQIHTAMGKYQGRIERLYLLPNAAVAQRRADVLAAGHPKLKVLYTADSAVLAISSARADGVVPAYYLVDPQGWIMMYYRGDTDGKDVMADLKFLIKNSGG
jgi:cytochrome oxidase Cu insertion factor (SCO1/SenC/PrrC family)